MGKSTTSPRRCYPTLRSLDQAGSAPVLRLTQKGPYGRSPMRPTVGRFLPPPEPLCRRGKSSLVLRPKFCEKGAPSEALPDTLYYTCHGSVERSAERGRSRRGRGGVLLALPAGGRGLIPIVESKLLLIFATRKTPQGGCLNPAVVAQLVEHQLPKLRVTSSSLAYRSPCEGVFFSFLREGYPLAICYIHYTLSSFT